MGALDYFKLALSKYADFEGRSRRSEYWYFVLFASLIGFAAGLVAGVLAGIVGEWVAFLAYIPSLYFLVPNLAVAVRRLHDVGRSGWWLLIYFTGIGAFVLLYWFVKDSDPGSNEYGPNPKLGTDSIEDHLTIS